MIFFSVLSFLGFDQLQIWQDGDKIVGYHEQNVFVAKWYVQILFKNAGMVSYSIVFFLFRFVQLCNFKKENKTKYFSSFIYYWCFYTRVYSWKKWAKIGNKNVCSSEFVHHINTSFYGRPFQFDNEAVYKSVASLPWPYPTIR